MEEQPSIIERHEPLLANLKHVFNNPDMYTDCRLVFNKTGNVIYCHKFILSLNSEFFKVCFQCQMQEALSDTIEIEEDEAIFTHLIESFYSGRLVVKHKVWIIPLLVMAGKYQVPDLELPLAKQLTSSLSIHNVLHCWQLDSENPVFDQLFTCVKAFMASHSRQLLEGDSFLELDIDVWSHILSSLVSDSGSYELAINAIDRWIEHNEDERAQYSYALIKTISKRRENEKSGKHMNRFNPDRLGPHASISHDYQRIKRDGTSGYRCTALGMKTNKYSIRILNNCFGLMIGMAPDTIDVRADYNYKKCGWYLDIASGKLYSGDGYFNVPYSPISANTKGCIVSAHLERGNLSFSINGKDLGVAYHNLPGDLYPAFLLFNYYSEFEFVNT